MNNLANPMGTDGFEFLEFASPTPEKLAQDFITLGFQRIAKHKTKNIDLYRQGEINFLINNEVNSHADHFKRIHGPCVSAMGFRVKDAKFAYDKALQAAAKAYTGAEGTQGLEQQLAIYGIGDNLLYFIDTYGTRTIYDDFEQIAPVNPAASQGMLYIDHITHNVYMGRMDFWANYYERLFNFREIRYFDIRGQKTGLLSRAMTSPCGKIRIPLNEATEEKSQIAEFLTAYNGEGIQHIALATETIYDSVESLKRRGIRFLDTPDTYYQGIARRVPEHKEDVARLQKNRILIDGNPKTGEGLLLQIFTENTIGPVFFEIIQRQGNEGFGEGNFQALFEAIELDQIERGVL